MRIGARYGPTTNLTHMLISTRLQQQRPQAQRRVVPRHRAIRHLPCATSRQQRIEDTPSDEGELEAATWGDDRYDEDDAPPEELSAARHVIVEPDFLPAADAEALRGVFDARFADPRATHVERFMWDYWHVPNQYTLIRTQARAYFPEREYAALQDALLAYGEATLGCRAISPIWLSYYVDGCVQELHADSFHGPFAFVLSLTRWEARRFEGGETAILKPGVLDFWGSGAFRPGVGLEAGDIVQLVPPAFNQLTVFDPRMPHGVRPVRGTRDPREARIVLHGWFTEPEPFIDGPLDDDTVAPALNAALAPLFDELAQLPPVLGTLSTRITVDGSTGAVVGDLEFLADTLVAPPAAAGAAEGLEGPEAAAAVRARVQRAVDRHVRAARFPPSDGGGDTRVTLPLVFE